MNIQERLDRLDTFRSEGRLVRNRWEGEAEGKKTACLLAALSPEAGMTGSASACPADVMPAWLAYLTPWIDDAGTEAAWSGFVARYAALARRWHVLSPDSWFRLKFAVYSAALSEAMKHTEDTRVIEVCNTTISLCDRAAAGDIPTEEEFVAAESAAWGAATGVAESAARSAATGAAWSAVYSAARSAAADRLIDVFLRLIETACNAAERT